MTTFHRASFRAMGCQATVVVDGGADLLGMAKASVDELEQTWSRFLPGSDITKLNLAGGARRRVRPSTITLIRAMVDSWRATGGAFDPTLLAPLVALGYRTSFSEPCNQTVLAPHTRLKGQPALIQLDAEAGTVRLPPGTALDPGGIGKGLAADMVADALIEAGAGGALLDIGGDLAVRGNAPAADGWRVSVGDDGAESIRLMRGGVATSGLERRSLISPTGTTAHHLLDPNTSAPVASTVREATVVAGTTAWAEAWAKVVIVSRAGEALVHLDRMGLAARVRRGDGTVEHNDAWKAFAVPSGALR